MSGGCPVVARTRSASSSLPAGPAIPPSDRVNFALVEPAKSSDAPWLPRPPSRCCLCLNDLGALARRETAGAHADARDRIAVERPHRHEVRQPATLGQLVYVADRMTDGGALRAHIGSTGRGPRPPAVR